MRRFFLILCAGLLAQVAAAQEASNANAGEVRVLDKLTGEVFDISLNVGDTWAVGFLTVTLNECRYPTANPSGDAYLEMDVLYQEEPAFSGWMLASSPALSAMDHPRYDVWPLRCITS